MHFGMIRVALAALVLCLPVPVVAQVGQSQAVVVSSCGSVTLPINEPRLVYMDQSGRLCTVGGTASAGTNRSASIGTTASTLMPANTARRGWKVKNDCANAIWISFDGAAATASGSGNIKVPAGGYLASEPSFVETGAMSAIAEASACLVTAREH